MPICYDRFFRIAEDFDDDAHVSRSLETTPKVLGNARGITDDDLCHAAWEGNIPLLMRAGSDRCRARQGLLQKAILNNQASCVTFLLCAYELDVNVKNADGRTPLFVASAISNVEIVNLLLIHGADPNIPSEKHGVFPLHTVTDVQVARRLVGAKADPAAKALFQTTALHTTLRHASCDTVKFIMSVLPAEELETSAPDLETYFSYAVRRRCPYVNVLELLYAMCKRNLVVDKDLHAAVSNGYAGLLRPIVRALGDANVRDADGLTALHTVCMGPPNAFASAAALVRYGADVNATTKEGYTPLLYALWRPRIAKLLLRHGADARFVLGVTRDMIDHLKAGLSSKNNIRTADNIEHMIAYTQKRICPCGKFSHRFCTGCRGAYYCNTACQGMDFQQHRAHCEPPM